jgi:hypothetical protein
VASLTWGDVVIIGAVACVGFTLLSFWFSGVMSRRNWSWQVRPKKPDGAKVSATVPSAVHQGGPAAPSSPQGPNKP